MNSIQLHIMYYNESSAPHYSRNPLSALNTNIDSVATSKKNSIPHNQSIQYTKKSRVQKNKTNESFDEIFQSSIHRDTSVKGMKNFFKDKENLQLTKEQKIQQLRNEINKSDRDDHAATPKVSRGSKHINASRASSFKNTNIFLDKTSGEKSMIEFTPQQSMFSPKILSRSKSLVRKLDVSTLLYEDARRRQEKQQCLLQSERKQRDLLMSPKINSNTNALVLKKIYAEFQQLVTEEDLNPLIALSVLEEIFNVNLNPNKQSSNYLAVQQLITILNGNSGYGEVRAERLWHFIIVIIMGETQRGIFSNEQFKQIIQNYQYFYKERVTKQKRVNSPQRPTFRPKTLESSNKLAHSFREKTCQKVDNFIQNQKVSINIKNGTYTIEDLFIIDHHKKLAENEKKRIDQENRQLQRCSFKPDLSPSSSTAHAIRQKPKIALRATKAQTLKTQYNQNLHNNQQEKSQMSISKINPTKNRQQRERARKVRQERMSTLTDNIKDVEKVIMRMSVGRQKRQFSKKVMDRGYPKNENWTEYQRVMHRQSIQNNKKLKGFTSQ